MTAHMHPCPQCGAPLRWIPEAGFWNCDQCGNRITPNAAPATPPPGNYPPQQHGDPQQHGGPQQQGYPPQQQGYPPQGYPPQQGYGHYPQPGAPGKGKGKLVAIIAAAAALAAGGIVLAIVLSKRGSGDGGGGGGGGFESAEALAKATLEALAAGDANKLASFMPTVEMGDTAMDCPAEAKAKNAEEAKKGFEETKKKLAEAAAKMKGSGATFKSAHTDGIARQELKAGDKAGECTAKVTIAFTGVGVEYDFLRPSDKAKQDHKTTYGVMVLDGKYYLLDVGNLPESVDPENGTITEPTTPTPPDTPTGEPDLNAAVAEFEQIKSAACSCTDKACAEGEIAKLTAAAQKYPDVGMRDPVVKDKLTAIAASVAACVKKFEGGQTPTPPEPPEPPQPPTEPGKGLPECEAYAKAAERFIKCSKVPKQSQDAVKTAVDTMRKNWGDPSKMGDDMKKSAAETCTTLEKSMKDAAAAMGCK